MENRIDTIITLSNDTKHMVIDQGNYHGKCYFLTSILDNEENLTGNLTILEERKSNYVTTVKLVNDEKLLKALIKYFIKRAGVDA